MGYNLNRKNKKKKYDEKLQHIIHKHGNDILNAKSFIKSKDYMQHGTKSVFQHSMDVAKMSLHISKLLPFQFKEREMVRGALLHDYFQYNWHDKKVRIRKPSDIKKLHGFTHPATAMKNAHRDFGLNGTEKEIIVKHMWPLTFSMPKNREAWVVTFADKICSTRETLHRRKHK